MTEVPATEHAAKQILAAWGMPVVEGALATTAEEAASIAGRLDGRVAIKVSSPDLIHKTEVGGVVLGVAGADEARIAFEKIMTSVAASAPSAHVEGARVERMRSGIEVIVGMTTDGSFGPMALVGLGGVAVEGLGDQQMAPAPVGQIGAARMLSRIPGLKTRLERGGAGPDAMARLAELVVDISRRFVGSGLAEMEMNPVAWTGESWEILDAVMVARPTEGGSDGSVG
jgi:succinyl-CoA synthetase beta subunit